MAISRHRSRGSAMASGCMGRGHPSTAIAAILPSSCWIPTPRPLMAIFAGTKRYFPISSARPDVRNDEGQRALHAQVVVRSPFSTGPRTAAARRPGTNHHLRIACQRASRHSIPDIPPELRGTYAGLAHPVTIDYLKAARGHRGRVDAGAPFRPGHAPARTGSAQLLGLQHIGFSRAAQRIRRDQTPGPTGPEFKQMVKAMHEAGIEVILDVVYNHTAEGNHLGPILSSRASTTRPTTG